MKLQVFVANEIVFLRMFPLGHIAYVKCVLHWRLELGIIPVILKQWLMFPSPVN